MATPKKTEIYKRIGKRLAWERKAKGITQEDAAAHIGWSRCSIANLEAGIQKTALDKMQSLCALYGITLTQLMDDNWKAPECRHTWICKDCGAWEHAPATTGGKEA